MDRPEHPYPPAGSNPHPHAHNHASVRPVRPVRPYTRRAGEADLRRPTAALSPSARPRPAFFGPYRATPKGFASHGRARSYEVVGPDGVHAVVDHLMAASMAQNKNSAHHAAVRAVVPLLRRVLDRLRATPRPDDGVHAALHDSDIEHLARYLVELDAGAAGVDATPMPTRPRRDERDRGEVLNGRNPAGDERLLAAVATTARAMPPTQGRNFPP